MNMDTAVWGQIITFLTVILGFLFQYLRESRQHRWDREDRRNIAATAQEQMASTASQLAIVTAKTEERITQKIADNTEISKVAFREANDVNLKIHALGLDKRLMKPEAKS